MSMLLQSSDGTEFELAVIEDHLPDLQDGDHDDATMTLSFRVATPDISWEESAPCLNRFEVVNLIEWLGAVGAGTPDEAEMELLSPDLSFRIVGIHGELITLRVGFRLDARPEEFSLAPHTGQDYDHIHLKLSRAQLRAAAMELQRDLEELDLASSDEEPQMGPGRSAAEDADAMDLMEDGAEGIRSDDDDSPSR
jgi:hypothetical protein